MKEAPSILFINRVYPPDSGATGRVLEHIASGFVAAGWRVSVLATAASRDQAGVSDKGGVTVIRVGALFSKQNLILRALGYAWMIPALFLKALTLPKSDVVVTKTDPPMLMVIGPLLKFLKGSLLIHWAQDLYPEVAVQAGVFSKKGIPARILETISTLSLRWHDRVIAVGRCMETRLQARGIHPSRIRVIPNVGIEGEIVPLPRHPNAFREKHNLQESFIVMYSGNMGRAHEFGTVLEAARILQEGGDEGIVFLFVGHGPMEPELRAEVTRLQLGNVLFIPNQRLEDLSVSLGAADVHLVTMQSGMEGLVVPSKFYGVLAAERPCLFVGSEDSEVARVILEYGLGWVIRPGQAARLATAIGDAKRTLHDKEIPVRGRDYLRRQNARDEFIRCTDQLREEIFSAPSR